jgi:NAD(P)-dependent dehydrogenase (short-subunit alcohol dehydrogenase family)
MKESKKVCLITGCNSGIGKIAAIEIAKQGFEIIMLVRNSQKSKNAFEEIKTESNSEDVKMFFVDFASQESIRQVAKVVKKNYSKIDILINNAGVYKKKLELTVDGYETTIAVNYLATFLLTNLLLDLVKKSQLKRIINVSSMLYLKGKLDLNEELTYSGKYNQTKAYANSKLLMIYFTQELARRLKKDDVVVNCLHPGVIATQIFRDFPKWLNKISKYIITDIKKGSEPLIYVATSDEANSVSGKYFYKEKLVENSKLKLDKELFLKVWNYSLKKTS